VVDGERRFGNGWLLPAGPLREGTSRLDTVDAVVVNGGSLGLPHEYGMRLEGRVFYNLRQPERRADAGDLPVGAKAAVAGIGNPQRFFAHLRGLGLAFEAHAYPDHHAYRPDDLALAGVDVILMTEKDAVKCAAFADERCWVLAVEAVVPPGFAEMIVEKLRKANGRQAA
jgi:tetraacyldisaccharide 4'-kinase